MWSNLSSGQRWVVVSFIAALLFLATTFFLQDNIRTFAYIVISMGVALYAILGKQDLGAKRKND